MVTSNTRFSPKTLTQRPSESKSMSNQFEPRNVILKNVTLFWAKLDKPVDNFAGDAQQWEIQVRVPKKRKAELEEFGKIKEQDDGTVSINFRKKSEKADGSPAAKVRVVDSAKEPMDSKSIGNGSTGNVMLMLKDYEIKHPKTGKVTKSGTQTMLTAVQVTNLVIFEKSGGENFTDFDMEDSPAPAKKAAAKSKAKPAADEQDEDDIPF
jgi:hypothetical protein